MIRRATSIPLDAYLAALQSLEEFGQVEMACADGVQLYVHCSAEVADKLPLIVQVEQQDGDDLLIRQIPIVAETRHERLKQAYIQWWCVIDWLHETLIHENWGIAWHLAPNEDRAWANLHRRIMFRKGWFACAWLRIQWVRLMMRYIGGREPPNAAELDPRRAAIKLHVEQRLGCKLDNVTKTVRLASSL